MSAGTTAGTIPSPGPGARRDRGRIHRKLLAEADAIDRAGPGHRGPHHAGHAPRGRQAAPVLSRAPHLGDGRRRPARRAADAPRRAGTLPADRHARAAPGAAGAPGRLSGLHPAAHPQHPGRRPQRPDRGAARGRAHAHADPALGGDADREPPADAGARGRRPGDARCDRGGHRPSREARRRGVPEGHRGLRGARPRRRWHRLAAGWRRDLPLPDPRLDHARRGRPGAPRLRPGADRGHRSRAAGDRAAAWLRGRRRVACQPGIGPFELRRSAGDLVELATRQVEKADALAPQYFGRLPRAACEVRAVEPHQEQEAPPPSTSRPRRTARGPASTSSTRSTRHSGRCTAWPPPPTTRRSRATTSRSPSRPSWRT